MLTVHLAQSVPARRSAHGALLLALLASCLTAEIVELPPSTISPCGDTPVFCYGAPGECEGLVNADGEAVRSWKRPLLIFGPFSEGLLAARDLGEPGVGFLDREGRWVIKTRYESAGPFRSGSSRVEIGDKFGFIDRTGKIAIEPRFEEVTDFDQDGYARFYVGDFWNDPTRRVGVIDRTGQVVMEPKLFEIGEFSEGVAAAVLEGPCWQEKESAFDSSDYFDLVGGTEEQYYRHMEQGDGSGIPHCRWALIDPAGNQVTEAKYLKVGRFSAGLAPARVDDGWTYIDPQGNTKIEAREWNVFPVASHMFYAHPFSEGLAAVMDMDRGWLYIDLSGRVVLNPPYRFVGDFRDGLALVWDKTNDRDRDLFIDRTGNPAFERAVSNPTDFCHGVAQVRLRLGPGGQTALINTNGEIVFAW